MKSEKLYIFLLQFGICKKVVQLDSTCFSDSNKQSMDN